MAHFSPTLELPILQTQIYQACRSNELALAETIIKNNPHLDLDVKFHFDTTILHEVCTNFHSEAVLKLLLAHPGNIDFNARDANGETPLYRACANNRQLSVKLLMEDVRVDVNQGDNDLETPLWVAVHWGIIDVVELMISSGRDLYLGNPHLDNFYVLKEARLKRSTDSSNKILEEKQKIVTLLENFEVNANRTRYEVRRKLGLYDILAAKLFATVIFHCDGFLDVRKNINNFDDEDHLKFFKIVRQLPIELQMIVCCRANNAEADLISRKDSEVAFKELTRELLMFWMVK